MPISRIAIGSPSEFGQADALNAALAEFISMLIFVFAGEGSGMTYSKASFFSNLVFSLYSQFELCSNFLWTLWIFLTDKLIDDG